MTSYFYFDYPYLNKQYDKFLLNKQTPSHGEDGSRTPGRTGAWDPTITNTPNPGKNIKLPNMESKHFLYVYFRFEEILMNT